MDFLPLAKTAAMLGIKADFMKLIPLIPLLHMKSEAVTDNEVMTVMSVFDIPMDDPELVSAASKAIRESNITELADLLSNTEKIVPIVTALRGTKEKRLQKLIEQVPTAPVLCEVCDTVNYVDKKPLLGSDPSGTLDVKCKTCHFSKPISIESILAFS